MYEIRVRADFSAAHNLKNYRGKCELLHGHNWQVEAVFACDSLGKNGIALDFRKAKNLLRSITDRLDHSHLNDLKMLKGLNPTSENIAKFIYEAVRRRDRRLKAVSVWENRDSSATYFEE